MKILLAVLGIISLTLGIIGIFLPLLPTTPFLLLSAFLFAKSSTRLYNWLMNHKILGKFIRDYRDEKFIPLRIKIISLLMLWGTILFSIIWVVNEKWWLQLMLAGIAIAVSIHILLLKTKKTTR
jgi:uncharacterized membrane protein YbaN (DUF454 family)